MKKTLLTLATLLVSVLSFTQIQVITTDTLDIGESITQSNYEFYYSDKYVMFGKEKEPESEYTTLRFTSVRTKDIGECTYDIHNTNKGDYVYISNPCNTIMILSKEETFIFY